MKRAAILINSLPLNEGVHDAMSQREIVTGKILHKLPRRIEEYVQAKIPTTNKSNKKRRMDALYVGPNNNGTGHYIFQLKMKEKISVPKLTYTYARINN